MKLKGLRETGLHQGETKELADVEAKKKRRNSLRILGESGTQQQIDSQA
jgi:hypothetical protein